MSMTGNYQPDYSSSVHLIRQEIAMLKNQRDNETDLSKIPAYNNKIDLLTKLIDTSCQTNY